jgi:hypothetical protein
VCFGKEWCNCNKILAQNFLHFFFGESGMYVLTLNPPKTLNPWAIVFGKSYPKWTYQGKPWRLLDSQVSNFAMPPHTLWHYWTFCILEFYITWSNEISYSNKQTLNSGYPWPLDTLKSPNTLWSPSVSLNRIYLYYNSAQSSKMVLLNGPPLSSFVNRGLGEWEWLGPGSTKIITLCNTPKNLHTLVFLSATLSLRSLFTLGTSQWPSATGTH